VENKARRPWKSLKVKDLGFSRSARFPPDGATRAWRSLVVGGGVCLRRGGSVHAGPDVGLHSDRDVAKPSRDPG
jgi:hypothetical protein